MAYRFTYNGETHTVEYIDDVQDFVDCHLDPSEDYDFRESYEEMLSECYGTVEVAGCTWDAGEVLREMDPTAFDEGLMEYWNESILPDLLYELEHYSNRVWFLDLEVEDIGDDYEEDEDEEPEDEELAGEGLTQEDRNALLLSLEASCEQRGALDPEQRMDSARIYRAGVRQNDDGIQPVHLAEIMLDCTRREALDRVQALCDDNDDEDWYFFLGPVGYQPTLAQIMAGL